MQSFARTRTFNDLEYLSSLDCYFRVSRKPEELDKALESIKELRGLVKSIAKFNPRTVTELAINIACQYRHGVLEDSEYNRQATKILKQLCYIND